MQALCIGATLVGATLAGARWLRVAQREHYLAGSVTRFALRWWSISANPPIAAAAVVGAGCSLRWPGAGLVTAAAVAFGPLGLSLRGRTAALTWTRRLKTLAATWAVLTVLIVAAGAALGIGPFAVAAAAALTPLLIDVALVLTAPVERRLGGSFIRLAAERLGQVRPTIVAITGSYGKTTTKGYVAHLVGASRSVVATPASFNNRAGLARAVNENLTPGTEVFVAEMGTYGPGEIADLCSWCPPDIAVITAIGPVHLERMRTEENIAAAKAEILDDARVAVLNVDHPLLATLADARSAKGQKVLRCSATTSTPDITVAVLDGRVLAHGVVIGHVSDPGVQPTNVACAVAVALEVGVSTEVLADRLAGLEGPAHRLSISTSAKGAVVIDDTYNSNPAGAASALVALKRHGSSDRLRVVVTPGMVELGSRQHAENARFAEAAGTLASHLVVVGRTNRRALLAGAAGSTAQVVSVATREQAVAWVREHVGEGDAVLYENDLPDHFA